MLERNYLNWKIKKKILKSWKIGKKTNVNFHLDERVQISNDELTIYDVPDK